MPSPFPGMDPFLEGSRWEGFHHRYIDELGDLLVPQVRPRYYVEVEERVYVDFPAEDRTAWIRPDVAVAAPAGEVRSSAGGVGTAVAVAPVTARLTLPLPARMKEAFLTIRERETGVVISVVELLSPTNKRAGNAGQVEYLSKRDTVLQSGAHLVELDLLRGGERLPTVEPLPRGDFYAFVSRASLWPQVDVYAWALRAPLPTVPVPLKAGDPDATLDLQTAFTTVYDRRGYDYSLDYGGAVEPPLNETDATWVQEILADMQSGAG